MEEKKKENGEKEGKKFTKNVKNAIINKKTNKNGVVENMRKRRELCQYLVQHFEGVLEEI